MRSSRTCCILLVAIGFGLVASNSQSQAQTGPAERKVAKPTRLDWEFAVSGFGKAAVKLPAGYDSAKQRYQLFVPKGARKEKPSALVLFISAGDGPQGWASWKTLCEKEGVFFASPFGAGNCELALTGRRTRIILDVLDDIRRQYAIDPDQTYITGFSGGGRMACAIGFALPEYFGGVIPVCGTNPISGPTYLRHRVEERLSVAFVTGEKDMNRKENEEYMYPWLQEIGVRSKLWVVPKVGHVIPSGEVMAEVHAWVAADLKRRREDAKAKPKLAVAAADTPSAVEQAQRYVDGGVDEIKQASHTWRGVALLQGVTQRWGNSEPAKEAKLLLQEVLKNEKLVERISDQGGEDEVKSVSAQAKALERFGQTAPAIEAWGILVENHKGSPIAAKANENIKRLKANGK